ncbi:FIST signal transduction protein [Thermodesulforhabdus norvegica]|uniref:Uncharacterized conserved protein, contains FIST_N domain n=1 Tax=Thermodesulforhabdus norvegica TaxID=39841 RepID=A0A1I4RBT3_9BACT|nr:FIST N-terminal domain-containing protein [Thermodesulforhabdus norvegica]SFM49764.1 Uncharacterized conserved protein, contains FIST_N domain [Thermodesulforhabdus norvegica]
MSNEQGIYVEIGTGFSFHPEPAKACREAILKALENLGRYDPSVCFIFAAQRYATGEVPSTVTRLLGQIPVLGCTTAGEILNEPKKGSLSVVLIASPFLDVVGVWGAEGANRDYKKALRSIFSQGDLEGLLKDDYRRELRRSGKSIFGVMFTAGTTRSADTRAYEIFTSLREATSFEIPFFGGCAGNAPGERDENSVFVGNRVIADGVAVAIFETSLRHGMGMYHGFVPQDRSLMVTRVKGHEILELNGKPVMEVLPSLLGMPVSRLTEISVSALARKALGVKTREQRYQVIPMTYLTDRGTLRVAQPVSEGTALSLMIPGPDVEHVGEHAASMALWRANIRRPAVLFMFSCALVHVMMGQDLRNSEVECVRNMVGSCPVVGFYSFGEQGVARDGSNVACHGAVSCLALGNELTDAALTYLENRLLAEKLEIQTEKLKEAVRDWENTFNNAPFGIMVVDKDFVVRRMNRTLRNLLPPPPPRRWG